MLTSKKNKKKKDQPIQTKTKSKYKIFLLLNKDKTDRNIFVNSTTSIYKNRTAKPV